MSSALGARWKLIRSLFAVICYAVSHNGVGVGRADSRRYANDEVLGV